MKKKVGIIGQFAPPIHGVSKAIDTLCNSYLNDKYDLYKVDIKNNKRIVNTLSYLISSNFDLYYLTIAQSKFGNIRDIIIIILLFLKKKKVIVHFHGGGFRILLDNEMCKLQRRLNYLILSRIEGAIVLGESLKYIFKDIVDDKKIYVVENCIDDDMLINTKKLNNKIYKFSETKELNIVYLSNFIKNKGYREVLELAKLCKIKGDNRFKFNFAGDFLEKDSEKEFFEFVNINKLSSIVKYCGVVYGEKKSQVFYDGNILILPLQNKKEGQPISIIEAMGNGLVIMTTDLLGINDIVDKSTSFKYNSDNIDIQQMYNDLVSIYENREVYIKCIRKNRKKVEDKFNYSKYISRIDNIFETICNI